ncbi:tRNA (adenosine(37)-N6)-threonylcarbamoyltransferase complex ATPase subunit type 1 TsaE [Seonamhaeicola marinus]|uniref:tRNA threonylcarbamoyladenosine biosynthesis protein TsaE n=1 Tax=Seonamhaeicola marinus TaxID=1912246 RepID=A0A5D0HLM9_9FLAO|nr:tRNA (adenosine(37)-N6)-threonylcarbamoyltransferase complex ATPase subunit type 1 TsaE [Seonamhaeicola marinus]TYA71890.1 tRNA (adenosine(37)-N6)-threonylcarbamoyltransferase complex ATPase subunit type 1 TsaE [Seonamhaeicola marinus]
MKISYTLENIDAVAKEIIKNLKTKTIFLYGDMGAGKTTLIKMLAKQLGSNDAVSSPTFSIVNEYEAEQHVIYHFDLYRIKDIEEAYNFGIEDYLFSNNWVIVEWPQLIEQLAPNQYDRIDITIKDNNSRTLKLNFKPELT